MNRLTEIPFQSTSSSDYTFSLSNGCHHDKDVYKVLHDREANVDGNEANPNDSDSNSIHLRFTTGKMTPSSIRLRTISADDTNIDSTDHEQNHNHHHHNATWKSNMKAFSSSASASFNYNSDNSSSSKNQHSHSYFVQTSAHVDDINFNLLCVNVTQTRTVNWNDNTNATISSIAKEAIIDLNQLFINYDRDIYLDSIVHTGTFVIQPQEPQQSDIHTTTGVNKIHDNNVIVNHNNSNNDDNDQVVIKVVCIDANMNVIIFNMNFDSNNNNNNNNNSQLLHLLNCQYIRSPMQSSTVSTKQSHRHSNIQFISYDEILFINRNHQITYFHIPTSVVTIWTSIHECLEYKKQSLGYFARTKGLLIGKSTLDLVHEQNNENNNASDSKNDKKYQFPPTIAITILSNTSSNQRQGKTIASIHSDGTARVWTLLPLRTTDMSRIKTRMYPLNVRMLGTNDNLVSNIRHFSNQSQEKQQDLLHGPSCIALTGSLTYADNKDDANANQNKILNNLYHVDNEEEDGDWYGVLSVFLQLIDSDNKQKQHLSLCTFKLDENNQSTKSSSAFATLSTKNYDLAIPPNLHSLVAMDIVSTSIGDKILNEGDNNNVDDDHNSEENYQLNMLYQDANVIDEMDVASLSYIQKTISCTTTHHCLQYATYSLPSTIFDSNLNTIQPQLIMNEYITTIDSLALKQREELIMQSSIFFQDKYESHFKNGNNNLDYDIQTVLHSIDEWFMKRLFRGTYGNDVGCYSSIHRALRRIVPFSCFKDISKMGTSTSIEIETILAMRSWVDSLFSVQDDEYVVDVEMSPPSMVGENNDVMDIKESVDDQQPTAERRFIIRHQAWLKLLLTTWDEEVKLQTPLRFVSTPKVVNQTEICTVLRVGVATTFTMSKSKDTQANVVAVLDGLLLSFLDEFQTQEANQLLLVKFTMKIWDIIAEAKLIFDKETDSIEFLFQSLIQAIDRRKWIALSDEVNEIIQGMSQEDITLWLSSSFQSPALDVLMNHDIVLNGSCTTQSPRGITAILPFASKISQRYLNYISRLALARCIFLAGIRSLGNNVVIGIEEESTTLRTYLHTISVIWSHSQITHTKIEAKDESLKNPLSDSILDGNVDGNVMTSTIVENLLMGLCNSTAFTSERYVGDIVSIAKAYIRSTFEENTPIPSYVQSLPNKSQFFLRLIAPFHAYKLPSYNLSEISEQNRMIADCILTEVDVLVKSKCITSSRAKILLQRALKLLTKQNDMKSVHSIFDLIDHIKLIENHNASVTSIELKMIYSDILLCAINDVIQEIQVSYVSKMSDEMVDFEYAALWSSAFHHAVIAKRWDDAFKACVSNPLKERRLNNYKRLVLAMVEAGALNKLISNILSTTINNRKSNNSEMDVDDEEYCSIDLYEVTVQTLVQAASERNNNGLSNHEKSTNLNYLGCLFSLHAAHNEWRRCCQAMDMYGTISQGNLLEVEELELSKQERHQVDKSIIDEIVLAAIAMSQLIELVPEKGRRFIVSGEMNPYSIPPSLRESTKTTTSDEFDDAWSNYICHDRIPRILTEDDLVSRATRFTVIRTLFHDSLSPESLTDVIHSSDRQLIEAMSRLGYFPQVIDIANTKRCEKQGALIGGREIFADVISHMICTHMLPCALKMSRSLAGESGSNEEVDTDGIENRPTLNQLRLASGYGSLPVGCALWRNEFRNKEVDRGFISMNLIQVYTETFSGSGNSLAAEVAATMLDLDSGRANLPHWLYAFLMGVKDGSTNKGLFARCQTGDPAELLRIYIRRGLLENACDVVHDVLMGKGDERDNEATSRMPERGSVDFVPYNTIDQLWNMIEACVQSPMCNIEMKNRLIEKRQRMEKAIEKHFRLMKISEMGLLSARTLTH